MDQSVFYFRQRQKYFIAYRLPVRSLSFAKLHGFSFDDRHTCSRRTFYTASPVFTSSFFFCRVSNVALGGLERSLPGMCTERTSSRGFGSWRRRAGSPSAQMSRETRDRKHTTLYRKLRIWGIITRGSGSQQIWRWPAPYTLAVLPLRKCSTSNIRPTTRAM